jgi:hypothetical protein
MGQFHGVDDVDRLADAVLIHGLSQFLVKVRPFKRGLPGKTNDK